MQEQRSVRVWFYWVILLSLFIHLTAGAQSQEDERDAARERKIDEESGAGSYWFADGGRSVDCAIFSLYCFRWVGLSVLRWDAGPRSKAGGITHSRDGRRRRRTKDGQFGGTM
mgnify:CR=1 FL=1